MRSVVQLVLPALCLSAVATEGAFAQSVPVVALRPSNGVLQEEFSRLGTNPVRELNDGRLLVVELGRSSRLVVADFQTGAIKSIGQKGQGPGEYTLLFAIHALPSDTTVVVASDRWLLLSGDRIVKTIPGGNVSVVGFDALGRALVSQSGAPFADSTTMLLKERQRDGLPSATAAAVRVASFAEAGYPPPPTTTESGGRAYRGPWIGKEDAHLFADGWMAVVRQSPYRVDWRSPDGKWTLGKPLPVPVVAVSRREKDAFMQLGAATSGSPAQDASFYPIWPRNIPPYTIGWGLVRGPNGTLLIPRTKTADHPEARYDVVNRQGQLERQINIGKADRILAFGARSVYVSNTDDDGIQTISRHPWP